MFEVRRMTPADKPAMLDICSRIWEGHDYLPALFDEWAADTGGEFSAVLLDGRLVGCGKLTFVAPGHAWLEGLRKDPLVKARGLGNTVALHFLRKLAARTDIASVRFATYVRNLDSITLNERLGFRLRTALSVKGWERDREKLEAYVPSSPEGHAHAVSTVHDEHRVLEFLDRSGYFTATEGLVVEGWRARPWSPELVVERYVRPGLCRGVVRGGELGALCVASIVPVLSRISVRLVCMDALEQAAALALFDDLVARAQAGVRQALAESCEIEWMVPPKDRLKSMAALLGLASWEQEDDFLVYELPLAELARFARPGEGAP
jgi:RimJ/RimL family protein N-acetyltransferase